jgi:hypothetical protein
MLDKLVVLLKSMGVEELRIAFTQVHLDITCEVLVDIDLTISSVASFTVLQVQSI